MLYMLVSILWLLHYWDSWVGIVNRLWAGWFWVHSLQGQGTFFFCKAFMLAVGSAHCPVLWVLGVLVLRIKWPVHTGAAIKKGWSCTAPPTLYFFMVFTETTLPFSWLYFGWFFSITDAVCRLCVVCTADKPAAHLLLTAGRGGVRLYLCFKAWFRMCGAAPVFLCVSAWCCA
jgi:hypothetical protein